MNQKFSAYYNGDLIFGEVDGDTLLYSWNIENEDFDDYKYVESLSKADLEKEGVTKFRKLSEEQYERIVERECGKNLGEIYGYDVVVHKGVFTFGCGAVKLTRKEIVDFVDVVNEVQTILNKKTIRVKNFNTVWKEIIDNVNNDDITDIDVKEIRDLLKRSI